MRLSFPVIDAINARRSVRTYLSTPLPGDIVDRITEFISTLSNPFGIKGVKIPIFHKHASGESEKVGTYGVIKGADTFIGMAVPSTDADTLMAGAYEFETLILYLTSLGLGTVWLGGTFKRNDFAAALNLDNTMSLPAISPVGYPEKKRMVEKLMRKIAKSDSRKPWDSLFFKDNFTTPLTEERAGEYAEVLEAVRRAPSATNTQPWRILKAGDDFHIFGFWKDSLSGLELTMRHIDMGIALCHFELTARAMTLPGHFRRDGVAKDQKLPEGMHYVATWTPDKL